MQAQLRRTGTPVEAIIVKIDRSSWVKGMDGGPLFVVTAEWRDAGTGEVHRFRSQGLEDDPAQHYRAGQTVTVWVDPRNAQRYGVELPLL